MKTPEEIKRNLAWLAHPCTKESCEECGYTDICGDTYSCDVSKAALTYIEHLEETICLMKVQMHGDCGVCKHRDGFDVKGAIMSQQCFECMKKETRPNWEYEGLPG